MRTQYFGLHQCIVLRCTNAGFISERVEAQNGFQESPGRGARGFLILVNTFRWELSFKGNLQVWWICRLRLCSIAERRVEEISEAFSRRIFPIPELDRDLYFIIRIRKKNITFFFSLFCFIVVQLYWRLGTGWLFRRTIPKYSSILSNFSREPISTEKPIPTDSDQDASPERPQAESSTSM